MCFVLAIGLAYTLFSLSARITELTQQVNSLQEQNNITKPRLEVNTQETYYNHDNTNLVGHAAIRNVGADGWTIIYIQAVDESDNPLSEKQSQRLIFASGELGDILIKIPATWESGIMPIYVRVWGVPE